MGVDEARRDDRAAERTRSSAVGSSPRRPRDHAVLDQDPAVGCSVSSSSIVSTCAPASRTSSRVPYLVAWRCSLPHLDEALRLKAEQPDARPIAGGTDLLVELNFDRTRPETILNLAEVPELKGWTARTAAPPAPA